MAGDIKGITIEIGGDTSGLQRSLKAVDGELRKTKSALRDVNKLLKLDPSNTELLRQKQKYLKDAIDQTSKKLETLKQAQKGVAEGSDKWNELQRDIIQTEQELKKLEKEYRQFGSVAAQQIKAAGEKMVEFGNKVTSVGQKLMPLSRTAAAIGAGLLGLGYKSITAADDLNTLSEQTGLTTDEIQKMQYASDLVDVSFEDMAGGLKKLKKSMTGHADTWEQLGVSVTDANGNMRNATDVFYDTLSALSKVENETERDQLAMELFGKSADQLAGIIDDGGEALKKYGEEAENLGLIMDGDTLDSLNEMNDTVDKLKANFKSTFIKLGASVAKTLAPALESLSEKFQAVAEKIRNLTPEQTAMILKIVGIVAAIAPLLVIGGKLITGIGMLLTFAPAIVTALGAITAPMILIPALIAGVVAAGILLIKNWDKIKAKAIEFKNMVVAGWQATKEEAITAWNNIKETISTAVDNAKAKAVTTFENLKTTVISIFENIKTKVSSVWNNIKSTITNAINSAKTAVQNAVKVIKEAFNFNWTMPKLKVPSITVEWEEGAPEILKFFGVSRIPHLRVTWNKRAYENPVMFTSPTVLATPNGLQGFGDGNGAEIVMGLNKLRELVGSSGDVVINVYPSQGMDVNQLADQIQDRFVQLQKQRSLAYA